MSYSAFSGMFIDVMPLFNHSSYILIKFLRLIGENAVLRDIDVMPLFNHSSYILIKFLRLIGENAVLRDKMPLFYLNIEFCTNFLRDAASSFYSIQCRRKNGHSRFICSRQSIIYCGKTNYRPCLLR